MKCIKCGKEINSNNILCTSCKRKKTCLEKYGVENPWQSKELLEKSKQTKLNKYGNENYNNINEAKKTKLKKYGTTNNYIEIQKAIQIKYGVDNISKTIEVRKKISIKNKLSAKEALIKRRETNLKKYGHEYVYGYGTKEYIANIENKRDEINDKIQQEILKKSYDKYLILEDIKPLFTLEEYLEKKEKYEKFKWLCKKCDNKFEGYYENGTIPRCPICYPKLNGYSNQEKEVSDYCKSLGLEVIENDREILNGLEIDIYLPDYKLAIEYNGLYWHSTKFIDDKYYHQNKVKLANEKGIRLLHIWEHEWLEEQELIKQVIQYYIDNLNENIEIKEPILYNIHDNLIWI